METFTFKFVFFTKSGKTSKKNWYQLSTLKHTVSIQNSQMKFFTNRLTI